MPRMRWTTGIIVALFMSSFIQLPHRSMKPAYAIEGAGGNADDGGGDKDRKPPKRQRDHTPVSPGGDL